MNTHIAVADIFNALPTPHIVVGVDYPTLTILEENPAHERVAMVRRDDIVGRPFLEVFPDTSDEYRQTGKSVVVESIKTVIDTGKPHSMPDIQYDIKDASGAMVARYWSATHFPILDKKGAVTAVFQETKDITHERKISDRLGDAEQKLERVLKNSQVGTWNWDIANGIVVTDANLAAMFGIPPAEAAAGLPLSRFIESIHEDDQERVSKKIEDCVASKSSYEAEYRTRNTDGTVKYVLARGSVQYEGDTPSLFSGTIIDITDRKAAERALRESEERLRFMADSMPQLVWITRPDGYHEYYNQRWYEYTGTTPGTTDGEGWNDLFHPDDQDRAWRIWNRSLKTGEPYEIEYRLYHAESERYHWVIGRAMPLRDKLSGEITKWYGTCTDIDDQKRDTDLQAFLAGSAKELATKKSFGGKINAVCQNAVKDVVDVAIVDLFDGKTFNESFVSAKHPGVADAILRFREKMPMSIQDRCCTSSSVISGQVLFLPNVTREALLPFYDDDSRLDTLLELQPLSLVVIPMRAHGKINGVLTVATQQGGRILTTRDVEVLTDITQSISLYIEGERLRVDLLDELDKRKTLEHSLRLEKQKLESRVKERTQQLQLTNEGLRDEITKRKLAEKEITEFSHELRRSNEELENFAYVASHDLQEPLRKIQAFSNLLVAEQAEQLEGDGRMYIDRMQAAAGRMSVLIEDLLTFSRVSRREAKRTSVDLGTIVSDVLIDLETRIEETGAKVAVGSMPTIMSDNTHMRQLFQNLIGNAIKFHKPNVPPVVKVSSRELKDAFKITVSDNGIGFDEKYTDRIFSVFQRLNTRSSYEGTGIGLAVCRKIVERYGGAITAKSAKDEGSTFTVTIPKKGR